MSKMNNWKWIWKMAWKDAQRSRKRLVTYISSIVLGIASLVAIQSFRSSVSTKIESDTKELIGADAVVRSNSPFNTEQQNLISSLSLETALEKSFPSMMQVQKSEETRLINARSLEGDFPFYGKIETEPEIDISTIQKEKVALVDQAVMLQLQLQIGDSIKLGNSSFAIVAKVIKAPGQSGITASVAPPVYFGENFMSSTGLETVGSRIRYRTYLKFKPEITNAQIEQVSDELFTENIRMETIEQRKERLGQAFSYLDNFLNLIGFIALLLGCVGVASSVALYLKEKKNTIATLRCLGADSQTVFYVFLIQIAFLGLLASIVGAVIGSILQTALPILLKDVLVIDVDFTFSTSAFFTGIIVGIIASILFTLETLLAIRKTPPLLAINSSAQANSDIVSTVVPRMAIIVFIFLFSFLQTESWLQSIVFTTGTIVTFGLLAGLASLVKTVIKKSDLSLLPYVIRQGLANTARPNNQTTELTISIGLGAMLITLLFALQSNLIGQLELAEENKQPNLILFDVQKDQLYEVDSLLKTNELPVLQKVPIVAMRIEKIGSKSRLELKKDSTQKIPENILNREFRVTYRDSLTDSEEITEGTFIGNTKQSNDVPISLESRTAEQMHVGIGDKITFNVQGVSLQTTITSIRKVQWNKMQTNFTILFPKGVLEKAPQTYAYVSRAETMRASARFQRESVKSLPNVSVIDLNTILKTLNDVVTKISLVIRFMAFICILTGFIVLTGTITNSKFQRIKETVLLRTLGASSRQIKQITISEYFALGFLASLSGVLLGLVAAVSLVLFVFDFNFTLNLYPISGVLTLITVIVIFLGFLNNRSIMKKSPLETLRNN